MKKKRYILWCKSPGRYEVRDLESIPERRFFSQWRIYDNYWFAYAAWLKIEGKDWGHPEVHKIRYTK